MPDDIPTGAAPSMASLVGGLIEDTQQLIRQEMALARHEFQVEWNKTKAGILFLGAAVIFLAQVGLLFGFTLVEVLRHFVLPDHLWACYVIVTGFFGLCGGLLLFAAKSKLEQVHVVPQQSAESLRQDVQAVKAAMSAPIPNSALVRQR